MNKTSITVCIPVKNQIKYIDKTISSVLEQTDQRWKIVCVDGFSTDGTWELLKKYSKNPKIKILRGLNQGMYVDWNFASSRIKTDWMIWLPGDDVLSVDAIKIFCEAIINNPFASSIVFENDFINAIGEVIWDWNTIITRLKPYLKEKMKNRHELIFKNEIIASILGNSHYITMPAVLYRVNKENTIPLNYGVFGDVIFYLESIRSGNSVFEPQQVASWRIHSEQITDTSPNIKALQERTKILNTYAKYLHKEEIQILNEYLKFEQQFIINPTKVKNQSGYIRQIYSQNKSYKNPLPRIKSEVISDLIYQSL